MAATGLSIEELRKLIQNDIDASNDLQSRIDRLQQDLAEGKKPAIDATSLMSTQHKQIGKDLILHIEQIEAQGKLDATDRTMLQALTARLAVHDLQSARLAEYRDLQLRDEGEGLREWLPKPKKSGLVSTPVASTADEVDDVENMPVIDRSPATLEDLYPDMYGPGGSAASRGEEELSEPEAQVENDEFALSDDLDEDVPDKSSWPLLYRIVDIDPKTPNDVFGERLEQ